MFDFTSILRDLCLGILYMYTIGENRNSYGKLSIGD